MYSVPLYRSTRLSPSLNVVAPRTFPIAVPVPGLYDGGNTPPYWPYKPLFANVSADQKNCEFLPHALLVRAAMAAGYLAKEIVNVVIPQKKGDAVVVSQDEHPRATTLEALAKLKGVVREGGTVTAGNASGVNDGACALLLADEAAAQQYNLVPRARVVGMAVAGVAPRIMGFGPAPAVRKVLAQTGLTLDQMDVIELNEAFAAQGLAVLRDLGVADDDKRVNQWGGAIALGHPLGASGARLATTAVNQLHTLGGRYALCTMCIGVGQGIATVVEVQARATTPSWSSATARSAGFESTGPTG